MNPSISPRQQVDLIVEPEWLIPIQPASITLNNHSVIVSDGMIVAILPTSTARELYQAETTICLPGEVLMPGLVNLHCHSAMSLLRGFADDIPLLRWLEERIWPVEAAFAGPEFVRTGSLLACQEMIRGGITCFNDMYFFPEATAQAVIASGMRASLGMVIIDFPTNYASGLDDYLHKGMALRDRYRDQSGLSFALAPHAPYTVGDAGLDRVAKMAAQYDLPIHIHAHETEAEIANDLGRYGARPLARLHKLGLVGPQTTLAHGVHLNENELDLVADTNTHLAHCPTSNLKLGSGIANTSAWLKKGINFGIGTDGAASNNRLDMWQEMRQAALLAKGRSSDAAIFTVHNALYAATLGGAKALGLDKIIGSIESGKKADMISVRIDEWLNQPCFDPASHLLYVCGREQVTHTWVNGQPLMRLGIPTFTGIAELLGEVRDWHTRIATKLQTETPN